MPPDQSPRRTRTPAEARGVWAQYAFGVAMSAVFWLAMGAVFGRMMRWW